MAHIGNVPTSLSARDAAPLSRVSLPETATPRRERPATPPTGPLARLSAYVRDPQHRVAEQRMKAQIQAIGNPGVLADYLRATGRLDGWGNPVA